MTDVNVAFDTTRQSQIVAATEATAAWDKRVVDGKLVPIGNGLFRVNDPGSWDDGEVFRQQNGIALPQHGLDMTTGQAALYTRVPEWHKLGNVVPDGITEIGEVMKLGGIDFDVSQREVLFRAGGKVIKVPGSYVNFRTDTFAPLGVVGKRYTPIQPKQSFEWMQDLISRYDLVWETAGALDDGRKIFISVKLPEGIFIDPEGINDQIDLYLVVSDSYDGQSQHQSMVTPWRPRCGNTERFAVRDAKTKWGVRHTKSALDRLQEARRNLDLTVSYGQKFAAEETQLAQTDYEIAEFYKLVDQIWEPKDEAEGEPTKREATLKANRVQALEERWALESGRVGSTAYAAERAITGYLDHDATRKGTNMTAARATAMLEGYDDDKKSKAHKLLLVNR